VGMADSNVLMLSHLLFADDTLIFCDTDAHQVLHLRYLLTWFEAVLGLKVFMAMFELE
jgi:hypothetical protein